ncbi:polysaccharide biosynthesis tyrosine autokinase [Abyssibacter profundi]|uniref:Non-specific protein-tyrosine kinase n=1 Tax=Abyssibacter profundi TaxID=2182787 RepID=A0A383XPM9_9GAMM|nr:polysaccharide biosynthesis tyrosine autokinase [Abyssibacter profundi]PWN54583.1 hypothetical protein DEH80_16615 [Abyssibacter profundi]
MNGSTAARDVDLRFLFSLFAANKFFIAACVGVSASIAAVFSQVVPAIYRADTLIQVEEERSALGGLSELGDMLPVDSSIGAEIEIVRSRSILGEVVEQEGLRLNVEPIYFPIIGKFLESVNGIYKEESSWRSSEFQRSANAVDVRRFIVGSGLGGGEASFELIKLSDADYGVYSGSRQLVRGRFDEALEFQAPDSGVKVVLNVRSIAGEVGDRYAIEIRSKMKAIANLRQDLAVTEVGRDTGIMRLTLEGEDRGHLEAVLSAVANAYVKKNVERKSAEAQQSLDFLNNQIPEVGRSLEQAENELAAFREKNKTIDLTIETESVLDKLVSIEQKLSELDLKRAELQRNYTEEHPLVQTLKEQREQLQAEKNALEKSSAGLPEVQQELLRLVRGVEVSTELYTYMLNKAQELKVVEAGTVGNVRILDHAATLPEPVAPKSLFNIVISSFLGLFVAIIFLVAKRFFRTGVADPDLVEADLSIPVYAVLPLDQSKNKERKDTISILSNPDSLLSEAFRGLRTSLHFAVGASSENKVLGITGPSPNVGKTFVSTNLAVASAIAGMRTLYVDADLRRGDSDKRFSITRSPGLSDILAGGQMDCIRRDVAIKGLDVLPRGKSPPNPAELFMGGEFKQLIESWRMDYDIVIIDTPPILAVTDPAIIAAELDSLFLIARAGQTSMYELRESKQRLERGGSTVKGVVINGMTIHLARESHYGSGYGYYSYEYGSRDD